MQTEEITIRVDPEAAEAYRTAPDDVRRKLALDLEYVRHQSLLADFTIMLRTPAVMLGIGRRPGW